MIENERFLNLVNINIFLQIARLTQQAENPMLSLAEQQDLPTSNGTENNAARSMDLLARRTTTTSTEDALAGVLMDAIAKGEQDLSPQTVLHPSAQRANNNQANQKDTANRSDVHAMYDLSILNDAGLDLNAMLAATGQDFETLQRSGMKLSPVC